MSSRYLSLKLLFKNINNDLPVCLEERVGGRGRML